MGKRWEKGVKEEIFTAIGGKNMIWKKGGGGQKYKLFR